MDLTRMLPEDLLLDVLRHLPQASLVVSRCVCKAWRDAVDDHCADLLTPSLEGIFLELYDPYVTPENRLQDYPMPVLFSRPSTGCAIPTDIGFPDNNNERIRSIVDCCNGLLLLRNDRVVNPATCQWAQVPPMTGTCFVTDRDGCSYTKYLVFDPTASLHYEVFTVPEIPDDLFNGHVCKHSCKDDPLYTMEWPPTPYVMDVFSSRTGQWEERSFVRKGKSAGTIADCDAYRFYQGAAYWHQALYVISGYDFVLRIKLQDNTYQVIELPREMKGFYQRRLGKSENGVYCAYRCADDMFKIWFLDESCGHMEWLFKTAINLKQVLWRPHDFDTGSWTLQKYGQYALEEKSEWDPEDKDVVNIEEWVEMHGSGVCDFLGFHPYKEIAIFSTSNLVMACHLNTSKVRGLGYTDLENHVIDLSFPYTPCWMGPLPGSSEHLIPKY